MVSSGAHILQFSSNHLRDQCKGRCRWLRYIRSDNPNDPITRCSTPVLLSNPKDCSPFFPPAQPPLRHFGYGEHQYHSVLTHMLSSYRQITIERVHAIMVLAASYQAKRSFEITMAVSRLPCVHDYKVRSCHTHF